MSAKSQRALGKTGLVVSPLILSGAGELTYEAYRTAARAGVNTFFWEPGYANLTRFLRSKLGRRCQVVAGTFHADRAGIERDVDTALRRLRRDRVDVFLLFWARSGARVDEHAFELLDGVRRANKVQACGFSTHERDLAVAALRSSPWDVFMVRHSAAHRGAETSVFPVAQELGVGVLSFSNTCYGRLLGPAPSAPELPPPSAADCYRYSLSQVGVTASISAPRVYRELAANLEVLERPRATAPEIEAIRVHGRSVYAANKDFNRLVRRAPAGTVLENHTSGVLLPRPLGTLKAVEPTHSKEPLPRAPQASLLSAVLRRG